MTISNKCFLLLALILQFNYSFSQKGNRVKICEQKKDTIIDGLLLFSKSSISEDGTWNILYTNNKVKESFTIKNGLLNGRLIWYWPNGSKMYCGTFKNGQAIKNWLVYAPDGTLSKKFVYGKDEKIKNLKQYDDGKLILETLYDKNGDEIKTIKH
jgi:antitoxin component YwqK of YwqJK toxin-antitoxin module